jgi:hypothetical protein
MQNLLYHRAGANQFECKEKQAPHNKSHIHKLWKLQKRAARVITSSDYTIRSSQIFETLQWHPIKNLMDKRDLTMMFKVLKNMAPNYLTILFRKCDNSNYSLGATI